MQTVNYARTISKNYQSANFGVTINFDEQEVKMSQAVGLAQFMVHAAITKQFDGRDILKWQEVYVACFHEPIESFLDTIRPRTEEA